MTDNQWWARELRLWIDNDEGLERRLTACQVNLWRKRFAGRYDHARAPALYRYLVDDAARSYHKTFGDRVPTAARMLLAQELADEYRPDALDKLAERCATLHQRGVAVDMNPASDVWVFPSGDLFPSTDDFPRTSAVAAWTANKGLHRINRNGKAVPVAV